MRFWKISNISWQRCKTLRPKIDDVTPDAVKTQSTKELLTTLNNTVSMLDPDKLHMLLSNAENYVNSSHSLLSKVDVKHINSMVSELTKTTEKLNATLNETKGAGLVTQLNKTISSADQAIVDQSLQHQRTNPKSEKYLGQSQNLFRESGPGPEFLSSACPPDVTYRVSE